MFKRIIRMAFNALARRWLHSWTRGGSARSASPVHLNSEEVWNLVIRVGSLITLTFLNFLLFMAAIVVIAVAAAHSFDVYDQFRATAVFWTGLIMAVTALVLGAICGRALLHTDFSFQKLVVAEPEVEAPLTAADRLVRPVFEGILEGLRRPAHRAAQASFHRRGHPAA